VLHLQDQRAPLTADVKVAADETLIVSSRLTPVTCCMDKKKKKDKTKKEEGVLKLISLVYRHSESSGVGGILFDGQILRVAAAGPTL